MRGALTWRVLLGSALLVLLVGAAFALMLFALDRMSDSADLARHSRRELAAAGRLEKLVIDLETGQRGFALTRDARFLDPWNAARRAIPAEANGFARLPDDAGQTRRAAALARSVSSYVRDYSVPLVAAARRGDPISRSVATTAEGKRLVDAIRAGFGRFTAVERQILNARQADADAASRRATVGAGVGLAGSVLLILLFSVYMSRAIVLPVRRAATMASRLAGGALDARMPETSVGEVGELERSFNTMATSLEASQAELRRFADEQGSLRRVATLVARGVPPDELLENVVRQVSGVVGSDVTSLFRSEPDGSVTLLAWWSARGIPRPSHARWAREDASVAGMVLSTGRPAFMDSYKGIEGEGADMAREHGIGASLGAPIIVGGRLWGVMSSAWAAGRTVSPEIEARMVAFTELVATAVANAEGRAELSASRARVVAAADETRRRIERDLHDGTQQRLVSVALELRAAEPLALPEQADLRAQLSSAIQGLNGAVDELQEISRGIHPAILSRGGLGPALSALARRSSVPVEMHVDCEGRMPEPVEVAAYYVVSEALANAAKHSEASALRVDVGRENGFIQLSIEDDGVGGADPARGSGLMGLKDRVEALGGEVQVSSPPGEGTALQVSIPIDPVAGVT